MTVNFHDDLIVTHNQNFGAAARSADDASVAATLASIIVLLMSSFLFPAFASWFAVIDECRRGVFSRVCVSRCVQSIVVVERLLGFVLHQSFLLVVVIVNSLVFFDLLNLNLWMIVAAFVFDFLC
jgi:hypothetical protein